MNRRPCSWDTKTRLTKVEETIFEKAARAVVRSILRREKNKTKRLALLHQASDQGYAVWSQAARLELEDGQ